MRSHRIRIILATVLAALAMLLPAGCELSKSGGGLGIYPSGMPTPTSLLAHNWDVAIADLAFSPQTLTVKTGATVTWKNSDSVTHTVTSADSMSTTATPTGAFSVRLSPGQSFSFTFTEVGTYYYECTIHVSQPAMHAEIIVQ